MLAQEQTLPVQLTKKTSDTLSHPAPTDSFKDTAIGGGII
jgi:hypothetical protein